MEKLLLVSTKCESSDVCKLYLLRDYLGLHVQDDSSDITDKLNTIHNLILTHFSYKVETSHSLPKWQVRAC